ncbi:hypothetical protein [Microbulbifer sp. 2201CG32-9]|uniref:hypothetical protein n=1 Tax=unclassified Microbulbifer TaxID=2619833 RepID=UPI00345BEA89
MKKILLGFLILLLSAPVAAQRRLAVPPYLTCDPNQLTAWMGEILHLDRQGNRISLRMSTDFDTQESLQVDYQTEAALMEHMRLDGVPFSQGDWSRLYQPDGKFRDKLRAVIWLCEDRETQPVINWQPPG